MTERGPPSPLIGANFADISNDNLILRRPRSGRLEGWARYGVVEKAGLQRMPGCRPFETHRFAVLLRVRSRCKLALMGGALPASQNALSPKSPRGRRLSTKRMATKPTAARYCE